MFGPLGGVRMSRECQGCIGGAGRECRYSGARRGIGGIWEFLGGVRGRGHQGMSGIYWGLAGNICTQGPEGV